jgi:Tol biopolymer transport system component
LTDFHAAGGQPASWSPNGEELVFASEFGPSNSKGGVFAVKLKTREVRRLTDERNIMPSWSLDGQWIYVTQSLQRSEFQLWKLPTGGGTMIQVTTRGGYFAQESPDGKSLYYTKAGGGIWKQPLGGGEEFQVLAGLRSDTRGFWKVVKDGIYYLLESSDGRWAIHFFSFASGRDSRIAAIEGRPTLYHGGLTVSPDGRWIIYSQATRSASDIMLVENFH